ncbi:MAG: DUF6673 family protein [Clostridium botulinum]|uniref:DUF6673 family protein n=1 Tax=Clostridium sporogenes TaxID=1509 RepID=UPI001C60AEBB|nr:DUF6673 family protein [Clostridium sporogenes]MBW5458495.1 AP endonuclease [Clostridium sporogenes]MDU2834294.1 DUF6673 family protein [Clostridium botulinum]
MQINGVELQDLDILDLEVAEKFEKSLNDINDLKDRVKGISLSENIKVQCNAIFNVFNTMFGEGTDKKVFGNKVNLLTCVTAFEDLVTQISSKKNEVEEKIKKYSPNRATRRNKK